MFRMRLFAYCALLVIGTNSAYADNHIDEEIPSYQKVSGVAGNLSSIGSDTLANLMILWAEGFKREYPSVNIQIQAAGSSTAPPALAQATANLGPMSRKMKDNELQAFESMHGYLPTAVPVAIDGLTVYVHKDNPLAGLTLRQIDSIFSVNRNCGAEQAVSTWGEVGLESVWQTRDIQLYGRNSVSGTYGYFKEVAMCKGDFKDTVNEQPGSASVVQSVSTSVNAIGYSGIGYRTSSVRPLPLAKREGEGFVAPTPEMALAGKYPLSRLLYLYVNKHPNKEFSPIEGEFLKYVLSKSGQQVVVKDGYVPLPAGFIKTSLGRLGLAD